MPLYDFECSKCKQALELFLWQDEQPPQKCPRCKRKTKLTRIYISSSVTVIGENLPSRQSTRDREDAKVYDLAAKARRLKYYGRVKAQDVLSFRDVERLYKHPLPPVGKDIPKVGPHGRDSR